MQEAAHQCYLSFILSENGRCKKVFLTSPFLTQIIKPSCDSYPPSTRRKGAILSLKTEGHQESESPPVYYPQLILFCLLSYHFFPQLFTLHQLHVQIFISLRMLLCHIKLIFNKSICFCVNLSLPVQFSGPDRDSKKPNEKFFLSYTFSSDLLPPYSLLLLVVSQPIFSSLLMHQQFPSYSGLKLRSLNSPLPSSCLYSIHHNLSILILQTLFNTSTTGTFDHV